MTTPAALFPVLQSLGFDVRKGVELCGGDDAFYCELIGDLRTDVLVRRREALQSPERDTRREYAHLLKGTLQVLGEGTASQRARDLEQALRNGEQADALAVQLLADLDRIDRSLAESLAQQ